MGRVENSFLTIRNSVFGWQIFFLTMFWQQSKYDSRLRFSSRVLVRVMVRVRVSDRVMVMVRASG